MLRRTLPIKLNVLLRVDFNVPIIHGRVASDFRISAHLATINALLRRGNTVTLLAHHSDRRTSLRPVAARLGKLLGERVIFRQHIKPSFELRPVRGARLALLENLRFSSGEESSSLAFAKILARLGDYFVNDAFGVAHRSGASLTLLPRLLPSSIGPLFAFELSRLDRVLRRPLRPLALLVGGAKLNTKLRLLERFVRRADLVFVGGAIANTLLRARGASIGRSTGHEYRLDRRIRRLAQAKNIVLPSDVVLRISRHQARVAPVSAIGSRDAIYDIGPATTGEFIRGLKRAKTVIWNGPLGLAEIPAFARGSRAIARSLGLQGKKVIVGGGDTVAMLEAARLVNKFPNISTGGGAMIAYLAGEKLPALEALKKSKAKN
jgi:phosphoglycerate kinase